MPCLAQKAVRIAQIASGAEYNLAVGDGGVLAWGQNQHGQCGHGSEASLVSLTRVNTLRGCVADAIHCGTRITRTDSRDGDAEEHSQALAVRQQLLEPVLAE